MKRFGLNDWTDVEAGGEALTEQAEGQWVRFEDVQAEIKERDQALKIVRAELLALAST